MFRFFLMSFSQKGFQVPFFHFCESYFNLFYFLPFLFKGLIYVLNVGFYEGNSFANSLT